MLNLDQLWEPHDACKGDGYPTFSAPAEGDGRGNGDYWEGNGYGDGSIDYGDGGGTGTSVVEPKGTPCMEANARLFLMATQPTEIV